jgi:hypothetical protein
MVLAWFFSLTFVDSELGTETLRSRLACAHAWLRVSGIFLVNPGVFVSWWLKVQETKCRYHQDTKTQSCTKKF